MRRKLVLCGVAMMAIAGFAARGVAYEGMDVTDGGTLLGTIALEGAAPAPVKVEVTKDPEVCGKDKTAPNLIIGTGNGIANAVVVVKAEKGKKLTPPPANPVLDQKGCEFHPHVLAFPAGSTVDVKNDDGILHNLHTSSTVNTPTNVAQPKFKPLIQVKVEKPEWPIAIKCDVHGWMSGYWISQDHPYYAVTDANGGFKITDLPAGNYQVEVWQEKLGKKEFPATITAKQDTKVAWTLPAK